MIASPQINNPVEASCDAIGKYLLANMPLNQVIQDFPAPNEELKYPSLSITHDTANAYTNLIPYSIPNGANVVNNAKELLYIVGQWDFKIQLDFWARNKVERDALFSQFFAAFNPQVEPMGLSLMLKSYFNLWVRYDLNSYTHKDDEQASQRQEWRTMVGLLVHAKHALTQKQFMITQTILPSLVIE